METPLTLASALASKLGKDELYTFLAGFFLGLIYFLAATVNFSFSSHKFWFCIDDRYYLVLFLIAAWLLATILIFLIYRVLVYFLVRKFRNWIPTAYPNGYIFANPDLLIRGQQLEQIGIEAHLWGLVLSVLILLAPIPWLFSFRFPVNSTCCLETWISASLLTLSYCLFQFLAWPSIRYYYLLFSLVDANRAKITFNENEWTKHQNEQVQRQAIIEKAQ